MTRFSQWNNNGEVLGWKYGPLPSISRFSTGVWLNRVMIRGHEVLGIVLWTRIAINGAGRIGKEWPYKITNNFCKETKCTMGHPYTDFFFFFFFWEAKFHLFLPYIRLFGAYCSYRRGPPQYIYIIFVPIFTFMWVDLMRDLDNALEITYKMIEWPN